MSTAKKVIGQIVLRLISAGIALVILAGLLFQRWRKGKDFFSVKPRPIPPPLATDPKWGTHNYMLLKSQGIRLHYVGKGDRSNPLMICVHGFPECWFSWRHQLEHFSDKYWVVAVDMRGYADSDKPSRTSDYAIKNMVEDLRQFITALGKEKCIIMAHDWGAVIAWQLILKYPELFDMHISCNGPHPKAFNKVLNSSWKQRAMSWYVIFFQTPWIPELSLSVNDLDRFRTTFRGKRNNIDAFPDDVLEVCKYYFSQKGAWTPPINYYRNIDFGDNPGPIPRTSIPTLIVWGTEDAYLSKDMAKLSGEECNSSTVKFVEGASHWVQQDQPQQVNKIIQEYLNSRNE